MRSVLFAAAAVLFLSPLAARADLIGDNITVSYLYGDTTSSSVVGIPQTATIVAPVTIIPLAVTSNYLGGQGNAFITSNSITITTFYDQNFGTAGNTVAFNGFELTVNSGDLSMASILQDPLSQFDGTASIVGNSLFINFAGAGSVAGGDVSIFDVNFTNNSAAPEPTSMALLGTGLIGTAGLLRRRMVKS